MRELTWENAAAYLHETGRVPAGQSIRVRELSGGVSNVVLRVDLEDRPCFVIKQCRERLRVAMDWRARLDRIWAERAALDVLGAILPARHRSPGALRGSPQLPVRHDLRTGRFRDLEDPPHGRPGGPARSPAAWGRSWEPSTPRPRSILTCGARWPTRPCSMSCGSTLTIARSPALIRTSLRGSRRSSPRWIVPPNERTLVLGDFSPKNILVHSDGLILLDFECAHAGDAGVRPGLLPQPPGAQDRSTWPKVAGQSAAVSWI